MTEKSRKSNLNYILLMIALCGAISSSVGLISSITGIYLGPVSSALQVGKGRVSAGVSASNLLFAVGGVFFARLVNRRNFRLVILTGVVLSTAAVYLLSHTSSVWMFTALNALVGFSRAATGTVIVNMVINNWFYENTGMMTSLASGFSGFVGAVVMPFVSGIIERSGWQTAYRINALMIAICYIPILLLPVGLYPEDVGCVPYGLRKEKKAVSGEKKDVPFLTRALLILFSAIGGFMMAIVQHFPGVVSDYGLPTAIGATMLSIALIFNTAGKLIMGAMMDRLGTDRSIYIMSVLVAIGYVLINFVPNQTTLLISAALIGLCYSIAVVGSSVKIRQTVGLANYGSVYPVANMAMTICYAFGVTMNGYIYDIFRSYSPALMLLFAYLAIVLVCCYSCTRLSERK